MTFVSKIAALGLCALAISQTGLLAPVAHADQSGVLEASALVNFHRVNDDLYRSGDLTQEGIEELRELGIKAIISVEDYRGDQRLVAEERRWAEAAGMTFTWMSMHPTRKPTVTQLLGVLERIQATTVGPVLVHCKRGADRTGLVIASYRIRNDGWSVEDATTELRSLGHSRAIYWWDDVLDDIASAD